MILSGIKNYFKNLKYFFTPIGTLAVGMFIGVSVLIPGTLSIISALIDRLLEIVQSANVDFESVKNFFVESVKALDWSEPIESLKTMISREWIENVVNSCFGMVTEDLQPFADAINEALDSAITGVKLLFAFFMLFSILGLISGFYLTRFLVRRNMAKRTLKKFLFAVFVDSFVTAALLSLSLWLLTVWTPSVFITSVLTLIIFSVVSLWSAYFVHGRKTVPLKKVLTASNVFKLFLVNALIFLISLVFLILTVLITNVIAGLLIGFAFVEIALLVTSMNAESYVISLLPKEEEKNDEEAVVPAA